MGGVFSVKGALQPPSVQTRLYCEAVVLITVRWRPESLRLETFMRLASASGGYGYVRGPSESVLCCLRLREKENKDEDGM